MQPLWPYYVAIFILLAVAYGFASNNNDMKECERNHTHDICVSLVR